MISTRARGGTREEGGGGGGSGNEDGGGDGGGGDLLQGLEQSTEKLETSNVSVASDGRGRARRSERRDSFSREEEDSRDPPQTGPRRGNTAVGRSSSSWIRRRPARRPSLHRRPAATVPLSERASRFGVRTDGRTAENNNALFRSEADHWAARSGPFDTPLRSA